jgi:hypothetical protein
VVSKKRRKNLFCSALSEAIGFALASAVTLPVPPCHRSLDNSTGYKYSYEYDGPDRYPKLIENDDPINGQSDVFWGKV